MDPTGEIGSKQPDTVGQNRTEKSQSAKGKSPAADPASKLQQNSQPAGPSAPLTGSKTRWFSGTRASLYAAFNTVVQIVAHPCGPPKGKPRPLLTATFPPTGAAPKINQLLDSHLENKRYKEAEELLRDHQADPNYQPGKHTLLELAVADGDETAVALLIAYDAVVTPKATAVAEKAGWSAELDEIKTEFKEQTTLLLDALKTDAGPDKIQALLTEGLGPNAQFQGRPLLVHAMQTRNFGAMKALIEAGAHFHSITSWDTTTFEEAHDLQDRGVGIPSDLRLLMTTGMHETIMYFIRQAYNPMVMRCAETGYDFNFVDSEGNTPAVLAAQRRDMAMLKILIDHGASLIMPNATDKPVTPQQVLDNHQHDANLSLLEALQNKEYKDAKIYLEGDPPANPNAVIEGQSLLGHALIGWDDTVVELLLQHGAEVTPTVRATAKRYHVTDKLNKIQARVKGQPL